MRNFAANPLLLPVGPWRSPAESLSTVGETFRGEKTKNNHQQQFYKSSSQCRKTSADMSNLQFKWMTVLRGFLGLKMMFCWLFWLGLLSPVTTNQTPLHRLFPSLWSPGAHRTELIPRGCSKHICDNVVEVILSVLPCLLSYPLPATLQNRSTMTSRHNDFITIRSVRLINRPKRHCLHIDWLLLHVVPDVHGEKQAEQMSLCSPSNPAAVC